METLLRGQLQLGPHSRVPCEPQQEGAAGAEAEPDYESMRPQELKEECRRVGLSPEGLKEELVRRLRAAARPPGAVADGTAAEGVQAELTLDMVAPDTEAERQTLEAAIVRDLAARMGVDPKRINVTGIAPA